MFLERFEPNTAHFMAPLSTGDIITVSASNKNTDLNGFFESREKFHVYEEFRQCAAPHLAMVRPEHKVNLLWQDLTPKRVRGRNILEQVVAPYLLQGRETPLWPVHEMLSDQWRGNTGPLLTDSYPNVFYLEGCIAFLGFNRSDGWWAYAARPSSRLLLGRCRIFSKCIA